MLRVIEKEDIPTVFYYEDDVFSEEELKFVEGLEYIAGKKRGNRIDRKQLWFQEDGHYFCTEWTERYDRWRSHEYFDELSRTQAKIADFVKGVEEKTGVFSTNGLKLPTINSCLINYYENGNSFIPPHKDTPLSFGKYPVIIGVSKGDSRKFVLKNKEEEYEYTVKSGSVFIMAGSSQVHYTHEVQKSDSEDPRYSMTFREFIPKP